MKEYTFKKIVELFISFGYEIRFFQEKTEENPNYATLYKSFNNSDNIIGEFEELQIGRCITIGDRCIWSSKYVKLGLGLGNSAYNKDDAGKRYVYHSLKDVKVCSVL